MTPLNQKIDSSLQLQLKYTFPEDVDLLDFVSNKAKERVSKPAFQENKGRQVFWKTDISLFSWNTRFEIRPFVLLPTI